MNFGVILVLVAWFSLVGGAAWRLAWTRLGGVSSFRPAALIDGTNLTVDDCIIRGFLQY